MRRLVIPVALAAAVFWPGSAVATLRSGAFGTVIRGPITPVCSVDLPCSEPAAGAVLVFARGGSEVARVTVGPTGTYRIHLRPGVYAVRSTGRRIGRGIEPAAVTIRPGRMARADFAIDTGIR
jgi:hypothetical protein